MKKYIYFLICIAFLSCDKREDFYENTNSPVQTVLTLNNEYSSQTSTISENGLIIKDTLKIGFDYNFSVTIDDEYESVKCSFTGDGSFMVNNEIYSDEVDLSVGTHHFKWADNVEGDRMFRLTFKDVYDVERTYEFYIYVFENWAPSIAWNVVHVGDLSPLHKRFVITGHDNDFMYGGEIIYYQIIVNNDTTNYHHPNMDYVFPSAGYYSIGVRAMDSNNQWSNFPIINNFYISN